jgi:cytidylate kinase
MRVVPDEAIIAIDGPAASGKSTLAQRLASVLGYLFFDTGVMYRAATLAVLQAGVDIDDEPAVTRMVEEIEIDVQPASVRDGRQVDVLLNNQDVTWKIRSPEVDQHVSQVSAYRGVRKALTEQQRQVGLRGAVVMVGRDIGTVVLPEADLKIYLEASVEARARRRFEESRARGEQLDRVKVLEAMKTRDRYDSTRAVAPMRPAPDAVRIDSTEMDAEQVVQAVLKLVIERTHE